MNISRFSARAVVAVALICACCLIVSAQIPEYDFYSSFRSWSRQLTPAERGSIDTVLEKYRQKLTSQGVEPAEIERRVTLIRSNRQALENDFWNRFFTVTKDPGFNTEPNAFLVSIAEGRKPGKALDVGMGEGRNALYLAKLGWDVTGVDPADKAVALAQQRATKLGVKITTVIGLDVDFDYGRDQWDLILYSWVPPTQTAARVVQGLKPGGIVVVEAGRSWFPMNGLVEMFKPLRILHYTDGRAASDFFNRQEMDVVRLCAEKPAPTQAPR